MSAHGRGMYHMHMRKRAKKMARRMARRMLREYDMNASQLEHRPTKLQKVMDKVIYFIAIIGPLLTLPQIIEIWINENAAGVSVLTWLLYIISAGVWLVYGIIHKERPIIYSNILWILMQVLVVVGAFLYG